MLSGLPSLKNTLSGMSATPASFTRRCKSGVGFVRQAADTGGEENVPSQGSISSRGSESRQPVALGLKIACQLQRELNLVLDAVSDA